MKADKTNKNGTTDADDNVSNNARYDKEGKITREDERDSHEPTEDWNAEDSRTGRHK